MIYFNVKKIHEKFSIRINKGNETYERIREYINIEEIFIQTHSSYPL